MKQGNFSFPELFLLFALIQVSGVSPVFSQRFRLPPPDLITDHQGLPQSFVPGLAQDDRGFIWLATSDGLCRFDGKNFKVFRPGDGRKSSIAGSVLLSIRKDPNGRIWAVTTRTLDRLDPVSEQFENFSPDPSLDQLFGNSLSNVYPAPDNKIWVTLTQRGLAWIDPQTREFRHFRHEADNPGSLASDVVRAVVHSKSGITWVGTQNGLDCLDPVTGLFTHIPVRPEALPEAAILSLHERSNGDILILTSNYLTVFKLSTGKYHNWKLPFDTPVVLPVAFATDSKGNDYIGCKNKFLVFDGQQLHQLPQEDEKLECGSLLIDQTDVLWVGTTGTGMRRYDLKATAFRSFRYQSVFHEDLLVRGLGLPQHRLPVFAPGTNPYAFRYTFNKNKQLLFNVGATPLFIFDTDTKELTEMPFAVHVPEYVDPNPLSLATDPEGAVWALYDSTAYRYDEPHRKWEKFPHRLLPETATSDFNSTKYKTAILHFTVDNEALWIATDALGVFRVSRADGQITHYRHLPEDPSSLSHDRILCMFDDPADPAILWIGTQGGGLCKFDKRTGVSRRFTVSEGLPNNVVYAAIPDNRGNLWIATNRGLCKMQRETLEMTTYTHLDGLIANEFNRFHFLKLPGGQLFLGGLEGYTTFHPDSLRDDNFQPRVEITGIRINNKPVPETASLPLHMIDQLDLEHNQNFLAVNFASMQFNNPGKVRYRYRLEGLDKAWIYTDRPEAIYTSLNPGKYRLQLNASNTSGLWSPSIRALPVIVHPPFWATWWAYLIYALAVTGIIFGFVRLYIKQKEAQHLKTIDELKTRFFSNITHEFRTPLTLILAPAEQLRKLIRTQRIPDPGLRLVDTIDKNAQQLLELVSQLMDLHKLDEHSMRTDETRGDLTFFVESLIGSFLVKASKKQLQLSFENAAELAPEYWFDAKKLERILGNLLSNALKFTPPGGKITISLGVFDQGVALAVSDTGTGIAAENLPRIFDRFYQVDDSSTRSEEGAGIGLALVKELVVLQKGRIDVTSKPGSGTRFEIFLPYRPVTGDFHPTGQAAVADPGFAVPGQAALSGPGLPPDPVTILLVEDNSELAAFIAGCLSSDYKIKCAGNGAEGVHKALELMPNLIISDVLMPEMDGFSLCRKIKSDIRTSHIPVILLTARASHSAKIEGLRLGADDYVTKPFHLEELQLRVRNLLEQRKKYKHKVQSELEKFLSDLGLRTIEQSDPFLERLYRLLEERLDDTSLNVTTLALELGMSRTTLLRKTNALTDIPTHQLLRDYRMKRAAQFLAAGFTVSETAYKVGFDNLSYFSKCFRDLYAVTPTQFIAGKRQKKINA